jgi:hypothetical protein
MNRPYHARAAPDHHSDDNCDDHYRPGGLFDKLLTYTRYLLDTCLMRRSLGIRPEIIGFILMHRSSELTSKDTRR